MKRFLWHLILGCLGFLLALGLSPAGAQHLSASLASPASAPSAELAQIQSPSHTQSPNQTQKPNQIQTAIEQGRSHYQQGQWNMAIALWQGALEQPNLTDFQQAALWSYLAMAYEKLGSIGESERAIANSLKLLESLSNNSFHNSEDRNRLLAQTLNTQGQLAFAQGQPEAALAAWQQTTEIYQNLGYETGITGSLLNQSQALETLGYYRRACQTILTAMDVGTQYCEINDGSELETGLQTIIQTLNQQPDNTLKVIGFRSLGNIFRLTGYLPQAQQLLSQSVALAKANNNPQQQLLSQLSLGKVEQALHVQAAYRYEQTGSTGDTTALQTAANQALAQYAAAERLARTLSNGNNLLLTQAVVQRLSLLTTLQAHPSTASLFPDLALQLQARLVSVTALPDLPPSRAAIYAQVHLAKSYIELLPSPLAPPVTDIAALLAQAQQQAAQLEDAEAQSYVLGILGHLYEQSAKQNRPAAISPDEQNQRNLWQQAKQATDRALQLAQAAQANQITYQWQWQLGRIYTALQSPEQAIAAYQAAAQTLQALRQDLVAIDSEVQFSFRDNVEPLYRELVTLLVKSTVKSTTDTPSQGNLLQAIQEIDALQLTELENFLSCNLTQTFQLSEPPTETTTAILYPILLPDQVAVILRLPSSPDNPNALQFHRVAISEADVTQTLIELRQQAENRYLSDTFFTLSEQVYDWLIRPFKSVLEQQQIQTLVFVSDGALRNVPMGILHDGERFLIEDYAIALSPGLQLPKSKPLSQVPLAAISFGLSEIRPDFKPHAGFAPLANVETELAAINRQLSGRQFLNQAFTTRNLQLLGDRYSAPIVHLATHGQFSADPNQTFLLAWDRRITLNDFGQSLQNQNLQNQADPTAANIELLILSACKTATGDNRATLGLAGVAIQSGARSTLASLWSVDDQSTAEVMSRLYQALGRSLSNPDNTLTRAEILRQTQLDLLHTPGYQAPFYWAPYVLVGNWS